MKCRHGFAISVGSPECGVCIQERFADTRHVAKKLAEEIERESLTTDEAAGLIESAISNAYRAANDAVAKLWLKQNEDAPREPLFCDHRHGMGRHDMGCNRPNR